MKERSILFSTPMVAAILDGRKTQTRRAVGEPDGRDLIGLELDDNDFPCFAYYERGYIAEKKLIKCPYGKSGDLLWVRETWQVIPGKEYTLTAPEYDGGRNPAHIFYRADEPEPERNKWRSPRYMPKWACRLWLEVTGIRVERLQDIVDDDCIKEGISPPKEPDDYDPEYIYSFVKPEFSVVWDSINGKRPGCSWEENPWVWVVEFKRITAW